MEKFNLIPVMQIPERIPVSLPTVRAWIFQKKLPVVRVAVRFLFGEKFLKRLKWNDLNQ